MGMIVKILQEDIDVWKGSSERAGTYFAGYIGDVSTDRQVPWLTIEDSNCHNPICGVYYLVYAYQ